MKERYARDIISQFPYPIASTFSRLRTDECLDPGPLRLRYILATAEAVARFFGVVALCDCRDFVEREREQQRDVPAGPLENDFRRIFRRPSWGVWMQIARQGLGWLAERESITYPEMLAVFFDDNGRENRADAALGELLSLRNNLSHDRIKAMHQHEYEILCGDSYALLEEVLDALDLLLDFELTFVSQIEVRKRRRQAPKYWHRMKRINGHSDDFQGERETLASFLDSQAVIFRHLERPGYLNLDPLLLYEEAAGKAPDIFFYNGLKSATSADYTACRHGDGFDSVASSRGRDIAEQLNAIAGLFGPRNENEDAVEGNESD